MNIYCQEIRMDFGREKYEMLILKCGKRQKMEGTELPNQEKLELSEKLKFTNTWEYWKRTPLNIRK